MRIPLMDLAAQYEAVKSEIDRAVQRVLASGKYVLGQTVEEFERSLAAYCGTKHAVGLASGTDALILALDAVGVGPGDEVITTPFTFFATAEAISRVGATPVFVDIEPRTYNIDPAAIEPAITERTKAVIPVHIFGHPADMKPIVEIGKRHKLKVIEDACQAIGAEYRGARVGALADAACFSFFPTKNLGGCGDGGALTTNDAGLAGRIRLLREHGSKKKYQHSVLGYNSRLDALQAAILQVKLRHLDNWNDARRLLAHRYNELLGGLPVRTPFEDADVKHVYHLYIIRARERGALEEALGAAGIAFGVYYPVPLHLQEVYEPLGVPAGSLPKSEAASTETLALPLYPELPIKFQDEVAKAVRSAYRHAPRPVGS